MLQPFKPLPLARVPEDDEGDHVHAVEDPFYKADKGDEAGGVAWDDEQDGTDSLVMGGNSVFEFLFTLSSFVFTYNGC